MILLLVRKMLNIVSEVLRSVGGVGGERACSRLAPSVLRTEEYLSSTVQRTCVENIPRNSPLITVVTSWTLSHIWQVTLHNFRWLQIFFHFQK